MVWKDFNNSILFSYKLKATRHLQELFFNRKTSKFLKFVKILRIPVQVLLEPS